MNVNIWMIINRFLEHLKKVIIAHLHVSNNLDQ